MTKLMMLGVLLVAIASAGAQEPPHEQSSATAGCSTSKDRILG
jgi:hypothetical protein